jgi:(4S)-4-hydroxy-5-phosphonooxypentane-2,3-dione isomerase
MMIYTVDVRVKPESVEAFKTATAENAKESIKEPGIARFEVIQQVDDPSRFMLIEIYQDDEAPAKHKETRHYKVWRAAVESMMAEPRKGTKHQAVYLNIE